MKNRLLAMTLAATLSGVALADQVSGSVKVGSFPELRLVDGWVQQASGGFVTVVLVPYKSPQHQVDDNKPYVTLTAWCDGKLDRAALKMANLYVYGVPKRSESGDATAKYSWDKKPAAQSALPQFEGRGKSLNFSCQFKDCKSVYPDTPLGSWQLQGAVSLP